MYLCIFISEFIPCPFQMQTNNKPNGTERRTAQSYQLIPQIPELIKQSTQQQQQAGEREREGPTRDWELSKKAVREE